MAETHIGPGTLLAGRFTLEDLLEETDGAKFWRATDRTLARNVAVHVIPSSDPRASALLNAARSSATVTDGHLLRVLDAAVEDDVVYVVNEWGNGVSLDRMLVEGPLSPRRAAWVVKEVSEAISIAHRHGVAHGRLLPENVMVTEAGSVKLIGFVIDAVLHGRQQVLVSGRQVSGDHEADVVNLAALLYASLTGKWPGTVGSLVPSAPLVHGNPLRPRQVRAGVPRSLDAICDQALNPGSHQSAAPVGTAHEVFAALSDYIGDPAATQVGYHTGGFEAVSSDTAAADAADLAAWQAATNGQAPAAPEPVAGPGDGPGPETRQAPAEEPDPDATQAGAPMFQDEEDPVDWSGDWSGARSTPPPPPPPLAEPEPKPLFAPEPASWTREAHEQQTASDYQTGRHAGGAGPRNGSLPAAWGPDAAAPADSPDQWESGGWNEQPPGRNWLRLAALIGLAIVIVVAVVFAFNLGRGSHQPQSGAGRSPSGSPSPKASARPLAIAGVQDFDPEGDGTENPELAHLAVDGNPNTSWHTMQYYGNAQLGHLKSGVGLVVDLGKQQHLSSVHLKLVGSPTSVQILGQPGSDAAPTSSTGLSKLGSASGAGTTADVKLKKPVDTRYFVVWLTSLPQTSAGYYQGSIAEIVPRS